MNYIYTLIPIALLIFAAVQGSKWNFNAATYMDKKYTNAVKGMMCVVIMYVHISNDYTNTVQNIIGSFAYVGVLDNLENKSYTSGYKRLASGADLFTV